jgi:hypothetical protein|tara:strand:+ start:1391 stop:1594 length:204 start_codon:yes stop_codon:yes gene_type:complete
MEELDTSGFYKDDNGEWFFAPNFVYSTAYTLERDGNRESVDGWAWYEEQPTNYTEYLNKLNESEELI